MRWARLLCGALILRASSANAQELTERARIQTGFITEARSPPAPRTEDVYIAAVPELALFWGNKNTLVGASYQLTGALHSLGGASEIANRVALQLATTPSRRTSLVLTGYAAQTTLNNFLVSQPAGGTNVTIFPSIGSRVITSGVTQGLSYELTPRVRIDQSADANVTTTLAPTPPLDTFFVGAGLGLEHVWPRDGLGAEARAVYAIVRATPPTPDQEYVTMTAGPRWRHDWSRAVSSLVSAGATVLTSPDANARSLLAPYARGSLVYNVIDVTFDISASTSIIPAPLTGQVTRAHQATLHGAVPISRHHRVYAGASVGYFRGDILDRVTPANHQTFDTFLTDLDVTWEVKPLVSLFARYQFIAQVGETNLLGVNPSFLRDMILFGVLLSSRPPPLSASGGTGPAVPTRLPQRVDRSDAPPAAGGTAPDSNAEPQRAAPEATPPLPPEEEPR
jgi:hypothetical protein